MLIRHAVLDDLPRLDEIFASARSFMCATGNPLQWTDDYPSHAQLLHDMSLDASYVCLCDNRIVATFAMLSGDDPTYATIYKGEWPHSGPYATLHRIAASGEVSGVFDEVLRFALQHHDTLRIDTHRDNVVMRHLVRKAGFLYCGIILCHNGSERLAYQLG